VIISLSLPRTTGCVPVSQVAQRRHLRSAAGHQLVVPSCRLNSCGLRAFCVLGPRLWNSLPRLLRDTSHNTTGFGHSLKTFFYQSIESIGGFGDYVLYKSTTLLTYILTDLLMSVIAVTSVEFFEKALPLIPNLRGVKHTTPSYPVMQLLLAKFGSRVDVVQGSDEAYLEGLAIGIEGNIVQSYDGLVLNRVKKAFDCGDLAAARQYQVPVSDVLLE